MSGPMKTRHTDQMVNVVVVGKKTTHFRLPRTSTSVEHLLKILKPFEVSQTSEELATPNEIFSDLYAKYGKIGTILRGCRSRDGLTQQQLAQKLGIHQVHVSQMENGKRVIGKKMAQKLAKLFRTDYRIFL